MRCKKFEISGGELPEQIVLGPTGHSFFSWLAGNRRRSEPYVSVAEPTVPKCTQGLAQGRKVRARASIRPAEGGDEHHPTRASRLAVDRRSAACAR
jgi:hypothetical protein